MKTPEQIFDWLVRHCAYYQPSNLDRLPEMVDDYISGDDPYSLEIAVTYIPGFHASYDEFIKFIGEPYSYSKHYLPLISLGLVHDVKRPCLNSNNDKVDGLVCNYSVTPHKTYIRFWLGRK